MTAFVDGRYKSESQPRVSYDIMVENLNSYWESSDTLPPPCSLAAKSPVVASYLYAVLDFSEVERFVIVGYTGLSSFTLNSRLAFI